MADLAGTYLERIVAAHRQRAATAGHDVRSLRAAAMRAAADADAPTRSMRSALASRRVGAGGADGTGGIAVIAEIKRRSPSKGPLAPDVDAAALAAEYARGGAAALSVLTDEPHFGGSAADLAAARGAVGIPVLRKDFTVSEADVYEARLMGADCVLLIAAALDDEELEKFHMYAYQIGLEALVEVHDEEELDRAVAIGADLIGVNQRNLRTFEVDHEQAVRMVAAMPAGVVRVAESGVRGPEDAAALARAGYHAILVGESLVTAADPAAAVSALRGTTAEVS